MRFENEQLKTTFELPDNPTRRDILRYESAVDSRLGWSLYERLWAGVVCMADKWVSEPLPELDLSALDSQDTSSEAIAVIKWASLAVFSWKASLEERKTDPNS